LGQVQYSIHPKPASYSFRSAQPIIEAGYQINLTPIKSSRLLSKQKGASNFFRPISVISGTFRPAATHFDPFKGWLTHFGRELLAFGWFW
jgi:hypothetical protein